MPTIVPPPTIIGRDGSKVAQLYPGFAPSEAGESPDAAALDHAHAVTTRPVTGFGLEQAVGSTSAEDSGGLGAPLDILNGDQNWTVEGWLEPLGSGLGGFVGWLNLGGDSPVPVTGLAYLPTATTPGWYFVDNGLAVGDALTIPDGELTHVALVKFGNQYRVYVNGTLALTSTPAVDPTLNNFGFWAFDDSYTTNPGVIVDEWRLSDEARYTGASFVVPTDPYTPDQYTVALWHMDDTPFGEWWNTPADTNQTEALAVSQDASGNGNALNVIFGGKFTLSPLIITASVSTLGSHSGIGAAVVVTSIIAGGELARGDVGFSVNGGVGTQPTMTPAPEVGGIALIDLPIGGFANPMTTAGDIIIGGVSGDADRLGIGSSGQVLTVVSGAPAWATASSGGGNLAQELEVEIQFANVAVDVVSATPTADGLYLVKVYFRVTVAATDVELTVSHTDAGGAQTTTVLPLTSEGVGSYALAAVPIYSVANDEIVVNITVGTADQVYASASIGST